MPLGSPLALTPIHLPARSSPWLFSRFSTESLASPQCSHLISQHLANSREHARTAAQEFIRADGTLKFSYTRLTTEIVNCCSSYHLPQPSPVTSSSRQPLACARPLGQHARSRLKRTTSPPGGITWPHSPRPSWWLAL